MNKTFDEIFEKLKEPHIGSLEDNFNWDDLHLLVIGVEDLKRELQERNSQLKDLLEVVPGEVRGLGIGHSVKTSIRSIRDLKNTSDYHKELSKRVLKILPYLEDYHLKGELDINKLEDWLKRKIIETRSSGIYAVIRKEGEDKQWSKYNNHMKEFILFGNNQVFTEKELFWISPTALNLREVPD